MRQHHRVQREVPRQRRPRRPARQGRAARAALRASGPFGVIHLSGRPGAAGPRSRAAGSGLLTRGLGCAGKRALDDAQAPALAPRRAPRRADRSPRRSTGSAHGLLEAEARRRVGEEARLGRNVCVSAWVIRTWLCTTRTTHLPPARASTLHSVAMGGEPPQPAPWAANLRGGSQAVTTERASMPGPKSDVTATGFPSLSSNSVGTNQDDTPGPVAMACQTSSGVPGSSTST